MQWLNASRHVTIGKTAFVVICNSDSWLPELSTYYLLVLSLASFSVDIYCTLSRVGTEMRAQLLFVLLRSVYVNNFSKSIVACCVIVFICIFLFSLLCDSTWLVSVVQLKIVPVVLTQEQRCVLRHLWASRLVAHHIIIFRFSATCCTANQWQAGSQKQTSSQFRSEIHKQSFTSQKYFINVLLP